MSAPVIDLAALPLDAEAMLARLRPWVECESPTFDVAAVNAMMDLAADDLAALGATVERIGDLAGVGDCVRAALPHPRAGEPGVLLLAHLDTVHPIGTLDALPWRVEDGRAWGPGILDMKGGTLAAIEGWRALREAGHETALPVTVLLTSDEEIGSPGTREVIEAEARRHRVVLVPEPSARRDGVTTGRYAIARFRLAAHGRPSHAGVAPREGVSAIREMARRLVEIEDMTGEDCTFSVGVIHGGQWVNCVTTTCRAEALSMAKRQADLDRGVERMLALSERREDGTGFTVELGVVRPVWEPTPATMALYETAKAIARTTEPESAFSHGSAGGGSDANFTGALGLPTLDGLGLAGAGYHTLDEHILVESLPRRARLIAGLMMAGSPA
ncbi:MAG: M20/M25/M40 family metallo-hydrolase [Paracoccaceae bacterium]